MQDSSKLDGVWSHIAEASDEEDDDAQEVFLDAVARCGGVGAGPRFAAPDRLSGILVASRDAQHGVANRSDLLLASVPADGPELPGVRPGGESGGDRRPLSTQATP